MKNQKEVKSKNCSESVSFELIYSDYINGQLAETQRLNLENHLAGCQSCREAVAELKIVGKVASELAEVPIPSYVQKRLRENLRNQLNDQLFKSQAELVVLSGGRK